MLETNARQANNDNNLDNNILTQGNTFQPPNMTNELQLNVDNFDLSILGDSNPMDYLDPYNPVGESSYK